MRSITRCIQPVWKFLNSNLPLFIWNVVFGVPLEELDDSLNRIKDGKKSAAVQDSSETGHEFELDEDSDVFNNIEALAVQLVELMATLIQKPTLYILIRFGLFPLINCLSHYMFLSKEQVFCDLSTNLSLFCRKSSGLRTQISSLPTMRMNPTCRVLEIQH